MHPFYVCEIDSLDDVNYDPNLDDLMFPDSIMFGYAHPLYAASFQNMSQPIELRRSDGWILKRQISGASSYDAMGCYPLFCCRDWSALKQDFEALNKDILTLTVVTDPFGEYEYEDLKNIFNHIAAPYKEHFVIDLSQEPRAYISSHHQRNICKALKNVSVESSSQPEQLAKTWLKLYQHLIQRHEIEGIAAFSAQALIDQLSVPGIKVFCAMEDSSVVGMMLWYVQQEVAYYHLAAYTDRGYKLKASFALFQKAIDHFSATGLSWISLGAGAGVQGDTSDGLTRFKRGWSTGTRVAYFCGHVFDQARYIGLLQERGIKEGDFFPAYRS